MSIESYFDAAKMQSILSLAVPTTIAVLSVSGFFPRFGLSRALFIALRSKLFPLNLIPRSSRHNEVKVFQSMLMALESDQFIVVTGPTGVGKSLLIDTALFRQCGVMKMSVNGGASVKKIISDALTKATGIQASFLDKENNWARVLLFYKLFSSGVPPTLVFFFCIFSEHLY